MKARHLVITGMGFSLLAYGCAPESHADQRPKQRFEVTPGGVVTSDRDALATRRARPDASAALPGEAGASVVPAAPAPSAASAESVQQKVQAHAKAVETARAGQPPAVQASPQADGSPVEWLSPDGFSLSPVPRPRRAAAPPAAQPGTFPEEAKLTGAAGAAADAGASVANQGTQISRPPAGASAAAAGPVQAAASSPAETLAFASEHAGVSATASTDPDLLAHKLAQRMRDYPTDLSAHLDYQMLRFLRDEPVPQLDTISTLPSEDREVLTALMDGLSNFRNGLRADKNMLLSQKVKPVLDLADRIRSAAELTIPTIAICSRVQGFGVYDPMANNLKAGVDNPLIIYCEVQNFSSQQNDKALWETKLSQEAVLYTETGLGVWHDKSDIPVDLSRNRRHDFFVVKKVTLPRTLGVGRYILKVTIVDEQVRRVAENSVPVQVLAQ